MERQPRLSGIELVLQLADAALAPLEHLQYGEARFVGERVEQLNGSGRVRRYRHAVNISISVDMFKYDIIRALFIGDVRGFRH